MKAWRSAGDALAQADAKTSWDLAGGNCVAPPYRLRNPESIDRTRSSKRLNSPPRSGAESIATPTISVLPRLTTARIGSWEAGLSRLAVFLFSGLLAGF